MKKAGGIFFPALALAGLAACTAHSPGEIQLTGTDAALPAMEHIALNASRCWFKTGDKAFSAYRLAPELQSFSGRPRILVVPYDHPGGKPLLVVEAAGHPARIAGYGALMTSKTGKRITADLKRWAKGNGSC